MVIKILKVGKLKDILKNLDGKKEVTVFLNIVDSESNYITGVQFDIDDFEYDGRLIRLTISEKIQNLKKYIS